MNTTTVSATKRGRKPQPGSRTLHFAVRMSAEEINKMTLAAYSAGLTPAEFARRAIEEKTDKLL